MHSLSLERSRKMWLTASIVLNLGLLMYFKYANFFVENIQESLSFFGVGNIQWIEVALPIGISFYTFQTLTYSIDVYRRTHEPLKKVTDYLLYIIMFPQLIAGPIIRFHEIADQLEKRIVSARTFTQGFIRFSIGLGKKVLIANVLARYADQVFQHDIETLTSSEAWLGILCYTFQIYFDFAGYSDMAIGLGKIFGFDFPENFNAPYTSRSITQFWRKWHITLGNFMKNYLYLPLGGNRNGLGKTYRNLFIVFLLSGLWHGAAWNFILWGVFHGFFLVAERMMDRFKVKLKSNWLRLPFTFLIVVLAWVLFRADTLSEAVNYYAVLFSFGGDLPIILFNHKFAFVLFLALFFSFIPLLSIGAKVMDVVHSSSFSHKHLTIAFAAAILLFLLSVSTLISMDFNPFIYYRF